MRWLVAEGEREDVFRALGAAAREDVHAVQEALPEGGALRTWAASPRGRARLDALLRCARERHPEEVAELRALAEGAQLDFERLLLANLRGDIGGEDGDAGEGDVGGAGDGTGCTDLAWRRERAFVAHNEDGAPALDGRLTLLTLRLTGEAPVTVEWYPGFLPANTFTATGNGLVWGINHIQAARPATAPGRHFVARAMQRARDLDEAVAHLRGHPSAGGFAYTVGECGTGRIAVVEAVAGQVAVTLPDARDPLHWHTNHLRRLPGLDASEDSGAGRSLGLYEESVARGAALSRLAAPEREPDARWFTEALTGAPLPEGVHRTAAGSDPLMTLCTAVAELTGDRITFRGAHGETRRLRLSACARGESVPA